MTKDMEDKVYKSYGREKYSPNYPRSNKKLNVQDEDGSYKPPKGMKRMLCSAGECTYRHRSGVSYRMVEKMLDRRVGELWDDIYSDFCQSVNPNSFIGSEFKDAVRGWILELNCIMVDGEVRDSKGEKFFENSVTYYVHPKTNKLEKVGVKFKYKARPAIQKVFEVNGTNFIKHEDIWYRAEMAPAPDYPRYAGAVNWERYCRSIASLQDAFLRLPLHYYDVGRMREKYGLDPDGKPWYCKKKESANSKEIEALKKKFDL